MFFTLKIVTVVVVALLWLEAVLAEDVRSASVNGGIFLATGRKFGAG